MNYEETIQKYVDEVKKLDELERSILLQRKYLRLDTSYTRKRMRYDEIVQKYIEEILKNFDAVERSI